MKKRLTREHGPRPKRGLPIALRRQLWRRKPTELQLVIVREIAATLALPMPEPRSAAAAYKWIREVADSHAEQILKLAQGE